MFAQSVTSLRLLLKTDLARRVTLFNGTYSARVSNMPRDQNSLHPSGPSDVTVLAMASTSLRLAVGGGWGVSAGYPAPLPASRFLCMNVPLTPCVGRGRGGCPRGGSGARGASAQGAFRDEPFVDHGVGGSSGLTSVIASPRATSLLGHVARRSAPAEIGESCGTHC